MEARASARQAFSVGRPPARWTEDIRKVAGGGWMRKVEDRTF